MSRRIEDGMTPQERYRAKLQAAGLCVQCGQRPRANPDKAWSYCQECRDRLNPRCAAYKAARYAKKREERLAAGWVPKKTGVPVGTKTRCSVCGGEGHTVKTCGDPVWTKARAEHPGVSRQRLWQIVRAARGGCIYCAAAAVRASMCAEHYAKSRAAAARYFAGRREELNAKAREKRAARGLKRPGPPVGHRKTCKQCGGVGHNRRTCWMHAPESPGL